jgi:hypothetical protein
MMVKSNNKKRDHTHILNYDFIYVMSISEGVSEILNEPKELLGQVNVGKLINTDYLSFKLSENPQDFLFKRGIYVGSTKQGFYRRLMAHLNTNTRHSGGWNSILKKMVISKTGKHENMLPQSLVEEAKENLLNHHRIVFIDFGRGHFTQNPSVLLKLEKLIMKAFKHRETDAGTLLNTRVGKISDEELNKSFKELLK